MRALHRMILRSMPGPFFAAFGTLVFILLLQFLITYMKDLVGRGLPVQAVMELVAYSLAYMVTLAVPMSLLLATIIVFGKLGEDQGYAVAKSAGISLWSLTWPLLLVGVVLFAGMSYFNSVSLPEANHRMRALWQDIRVSRPGFELEPGVFFEGLDGYAIRVDDISGDSDLLSGIVIFDFTRNQDGTIVAREGVLTTPNSFTLEMTLRDGEIHRTSYVRTEAGRVPRYERIAFKQHRLSLDVSDLIFERSGERSETRTARTMRASQLAAAVDSVDAAADARLVNLGHRIRSQLSSVGASPAADQGQERFEADALGSGVVAELTSVEQQAVMALAVQRASALRSEIESTSVTERWERLRADRYRVEYYKKYSMALACVVFVIVGIPLGLLVRRRGYGVAIALAVGVFLFYWILLVQGEKLADRGVIPPWLGIWSPNFLGAIGAMLYFIWETRLPAGLRLGGQSRTTGSSLTTSSP